MSIEVKQVSQAEAQELDKTQHKMILELDYMPRDVYYANAFLADDHQSILIAVQGEAVFAVDLSEAIYEAIEQYKAKRQQEGTGEPMRKIRIPAIQYAMERLREHLHATDINKRLRGQIKKS